MGTIQKLSSQVIDYAAGVSPHGHGHCPGQASPADRSDPPASLLLPASGAALYALGE